MIVTEPPKIKKESLNLFFIIHFVISWAYRDMRKLRQTTQIWEEDNSAEKERESSRKRNSTVVIYSMHPWAAFVSCWPSDIRYFIVFFCSGKVITAQPRLVKKSLKLRATCYPLDIMKNMTPLILHGDSICIISLVFQMETFTQQLAKAVICVTALNPFCSLLSTLGVSMWQHHHSETFIKS